MKILITGSPGVGKTTLIKKLILELKVTPGLDMGGFYTEEIREKGVRKGFGITTLGGQKGLLAHVDVKSPFRVGKYKVDVDGFEKIAVAELERALREAQLMIIDEIGKMELTSTKFREAIDRVFDSPLPVIATIGQGYENLLKELKKKEDIRFLVMTRENRDKLVGEVLSLLKQA